MQPFNTLPISQQERHFVTFKMCVTSHRVDGDIDHLHVGGGVGGELNDRVGVTISTEVEDEVGVSQLEAALGNLGVTRWNSFVEAYFILLGENQLKSGIDLKGLRVTSYEGGG